MAQKLVALSEETIERISEKLREPQWLTAFRKNALEAFQSLPDEQSNLYTKYSPDLRLDYEELANLTPVEPDPRSLPLSEIAEGIESGFYFVSTQSETIASKNISELDSKKIVFCDFHEAIEKHESILRRIFSGKAIKPKDDKYAALNSALFSSAWLVYVPKDTILDKPLRLRFYLNSSRPHVSQTWIVAEGTSKVSLITENYGVDLAEASSELVEAYVGDNASVNFSNIQNYSDRTAVISNKRAVCGKDARMSWTLGSFGGRVTRSRLDSIFEKEGASAEVVEVSFGSGRQKFDLVSDLTHKASHTKGRILSNSVLKDNAQSIFKGMIRIGNDAKNASAYLAGHSILLSPNAKADAIPGLEILTNEVKATHSASVAQIDDDQVFYMMTRGLPEDEAKKFIVLGFLEPGISRIESEDLRDLMRDLIEAKWRGEKGMIKRVKKEVLFEEEAQSKPRDIFEGHYKYR